MWGRRGAVVLESSWPGTYPGSRTASQLNPARCPPLPRAAASPRCAPTSAQLRQHPRSPAGTPRPSRMRPRWTRWRWTPPRGVRIDSRPRSASSSTRTGTCARATPPRHPAPTSLPQPPHLTTPPCRGRIILDALPADEAASVSKALDDLRELRESQGLPPNKSVLDPVYSASHSLWEEPAVVRMLKAPKVLPKVCARPLLRVPTRRPAGPLSAVGRLWISWGGMSTSTTAT